MYAKDFYARLVWLIGIVVNDICNVIIDQLISCFLFEEDCFRLMWIVIIMLTVEQFTLNCYLECEWQ